uniref:Choline transporter-like protein n=1 Tax=Fagus sylvatica TaxID=28930 RepID=A0A2N9GY45_FAGSY
MASSKDSFNTSITMQKNYIQTQEDRLPSTNPIKRQESITSIETTAGQITRRVFQILFYFHLIIITILVIFLTIHGLLSAAHENHHHHHQFHPRKWYPPLLTSVVSAGIVAFTWQWITGYNPLKALKAAFWLSPLLTFSVGILLILIGSAGGNSNWCDCCGFCLDSIPLFLLGQSPIRLRHTDFIRATASGTGLDALFISIILLSLAGTMHVIKNTLLVTISRVKYWHFVCGVDMDIYAAFRDTIKYCMGSVCIGSTIVPILGVIRGSARALKLMAGDRDEFLFSCADCYSGVASTLVTYGNRWGFVYVGVYNKGFVQGSSDAWRMFRGAICSLMSGTWAFAIHESHATEVSIYAFLIGYFMCRIALAWPQACVSAYYVAYAREPTEPSI